MKTKKIRKIILIVVAAVVGLILAVVIAGQLYGGMRLEV